MLLLEGWAIPDNYLDTQPAALESISAYVLP